MGIFSINFNKKPYKEIKRLQKGCIKMEFKENFKQFLNRVKQLQNQFSDLTEEATKNALIMPFFTVLGYNVFDTNEFMPEFICDVGTKKGEKIDYAILKDNEPVILIEAKKASMKLQKQQYGQLYRYFATNRCRLAILTNGVTYKIFSDINTPNIMDDEPFLSFNLLEDEPSLYLSSIENFCKENFDAKTILSKAVFQKYEKVVIKTLNQDLTNPSDELVKYFLSRPEIKNGSRITSQMIEKHRKATQEAMEKFFGVTIINNTQSPKQNEQIISEPIKAETNVPVISAQPIKPNPVSPPNLIDNIKDIIKNYNYKEEPTNDCTKLHIYSDNSKKLGIIKIYSDNKIEFKRPGEQAQQISLPEDIKNFL